MPEPRLFRHYLIAQDADGGNVELLRNAEQVCILGFDTRRLAFVHCHVLLEPLKEPLIIEEAVERLQMRGHPLLAKLSDYGEDEGTPYYITHHIDGETLGDYLARLGEIPLWLATLISIRSLCAAAALKEQSEVPLHQPLTSLRVVQTSQQNLIVQVADYPLLPSARREKGLNDELEKSGRLLKDFLSEKAGHPLPCGIFMELLSGCLEAVSTESKTTLEQLLAFLQELANKAPTEVIATALKPRHVLSAYLAGYQQVARILVNRIGFQSQRLDPANPYAMRGTLIHSGRAVLVEQILPERLASEKVRAVLERHSERQGDSGGAWLRLPLIQEEDGLSCLAEEVVEGISLADLLGCRQALDLRETYLVLASVDAALTQLEASGLETTRLRLEDIQLITGFPREDARNLKLVTTQLTAWPAVAVVLRAHPTLSSMSGRGTDPAVLLPSNHPATWDASWLSALGQFLLSLVPLPGSSNPAVPAFGGDREAVSRLFEDEIAQSRKGGHTNRRDFLARYARFVPHDDLAKLLIKGEDSTPQELPSAKPAIKPKRGGLQLINSSGVSHPSGERHHDSTSLETATPILTPITEKPIAGFAELLFHGTSEITEDSEPDWARTAIDAPPTIHPSETLLPDELVPRWLRMAVFFGGSMVAGAVLAHLSGHALWQQTSRHPSAATAIQVKKDTEAAAMPKAIAPPKVPALPAEGELPVPMPSAVPDQKIPAYNLLKPPPSQRETIIRSSESVPASPH